MDLKGAEIRNILELCMNIGTKNMVPLQVNVPYYQRPYRWDEKRINNLIEDYVKNRNENDNAEYFVGSVVLVEDATNNNKYDIIDGQQRITTVFLLNYLRFIIQRSYIEELISTRSPNLDSPLKELQSIYGNLIGQKHLPEFSSLIVEIIEKMEELYDLSDEERENVYCDVEKLYRNTLYLPERDFSDIDKYYEDYETLQLQFLNDDNLSLTYDRTTFNSVLKKALAKICVIVSKVDKPRLKLIGQMQEKDPNVLQYLNALQYEFDAITRNAENNKNHLKYTKNLLQFIGELIDNIRFCVIITGNEKDAYTLFEVLNDRAMDIDDLELIKNLFLKAYCNTSGDIDKIIDQNIGKLDEIWGDEVFTRDLPDAHKKLISYLGVLYLTADDKAFTNKAERYREILENSYLKYFNINTNRYSFTMALNDISVYRMIKSIIQVYKIPIRKAAESCINAENDPAVSITYRVLHLLNALKLDGVMPMMINAIIKYYMMEIHKEGNKVDIIEFEKYIDDVKQDNEHAKYLVIHDLAFKLWKAALLCKDYEIPRNIAKKGLQNIYMKCWKPENVTVDMETASNMIKQFRAWTSTWQYKKSASDDLKLKVLFINLFKTKPSKDKSSLIFDTAVYSFKTEELQLDHMEANKPNVNNLEKHFKPADDHEPREKYTNSLGNFMILDSKNNNDKNNRPLAEAMEYYENMCNGHWMNKMTVDLLDTYHRAVMIDGNEFIVPTEQFFNERASRLRAYFEAIVNRNINVKKVNIRDTAKKW